MVPSQSVSVDQAPSRARPMTGPCVGRDRRRRARWSPPCSRGDRRRSAPVSPSTPARPRGTLVGAGHRPGVTYERIRDPRRSVGAARRPRRSSQAVDDRRRSRRPGDGHVLAAERRSAGPTARSSRSTATSGFDSGHPLHPFLDRRLADGPRHPGRRELRDRPGRGRELRRARPAADPRRARSRIERRFTLAGVELRQAAAGEIVALHPVRRPRRAARRTTHAPLG